MLLSLQILESGEKLVWNPQRKSFEILDSLDFRVPKAHT
jgi:hypothetical protein